MLLVHLIKGRIMKYLLLLSLLTISACSNIKTIKSSPEVTESLLNPVNHPTPKTIEEAVKSPFRTPVFQERDIYRHPVDTLTFFGIKSSMKVLEIIPSSGWYTEILAPFLSDKGQYVMTVQDYKSTPVSAHIAVLSRNHPEVANKMQTIIFTPQDTSAVLADPDSLDMIVTFRNVHNWVAEGTEDAAFISFFRALKKGGILGVVDHRAPESLNDPKASKGYVRESDVIKIARKAGFKYLGKSDVNANHLDTKDYDNGVWTLPPTLTLKDKDREKYNAIGESDRMTLKFSKP